MQDKPEIELKLVSDPMYLCGARELVGCIAQRIGFDDIDCSKIALAVDEALSNIIRHGYNKEFDRPIWIGISPLRPTKDSIGGIVITIDDEAKQVEPCSMKGRALEDVRPGGLGVHIIQEVMDEVSYEKRAECGMRLKMVKLAPRPNELPRLSDRKSSCNPQIGNKHTKTRSRV